MWGNANVCCVCVRFVLETDCQDDKGCIRTSATRLHNEDPFSLTSGPSQHLNLHYSMTSCMQTCDTLPANVTDFYIRGKVTALLCAYW
jgi:hypothetical protein